MRLEVLIIGFFVVSGCKTASKQQGAGQLAAVNGITSKPELNQFAGDYVFTGPSTSVSRHQPLDEKTPALGSVAFYPDGRFALGVNFYRAARAGSYIEPGTVAVLQPDGKTRTETYTVSSSGFFGGSTTQERQIETTDTQEFNPANNELLLVSKTIMSSRPYSWFSKKPWQVYKTRTITIKLTGANVSYLEHSEDGMGQEEWPLNFKRN